MFLTAFLFVVLPVQIYALTPEQVFEKVKDSILVVKTLDAQGNMKGFGSGVLLTSGKIATNCHVLEGGSTYQVGRKNRLVRATLYAEDDDKDICILDAIGITGKPVQLGNASNLKVGRPVYAVGAPQGLELSLSDGIVSQLRGGMPPFIQTTAAISAGSSGGGLFDGEGRLVGLTTLYMEGGQSLNFAIPAEWITDVKPGYKKSAEGLSRLDWLTRAEALFEEEDWHGLIAWCKRWTKWQPENDFAWFNLGYAYFNLKHLDEAIKAYRRAIYINPKEVKLWKMIGFAYVALRNYEGIIEAFAEAIRIDPKGTTEEVLFFLGDAYLRLHRYDEAIEVYSQSLRINPKNELIWLMLGASYVEIKRFDDAIYALRQSLRIDPNQVSVWLVLGSAYRGSGNLKAADEAFNEARRLDPEEAKRYFHKTGLIN